jgi:hypothetical protein
MAKLKATKPPEALSVQVSVRLAAADLEEVDALAGRLSRPGMTVTRADALRIALLSGLVALKE